MLRGGRSIAVMSTMHLVGHDASTRGDDALALARALAPQGDVQRIVVHVTEELASDLAPSGDYVRRRRTEIEKQLEPLRISLRPGEELRLVEASSDAQGLHELAEQERAALVVVGSSHRGRVGLAVLGTVADRLLHGSPCPLARAGAGFAAGTRKIDRVLLAFDGSTEAQGALAFADGAARAAGARVDVITVQTPSPSFQYAGTAGLAPAVDAEPARRAAELAASAAEGFSHDTVGVVLTPLAPVGAAIVEASGEEDLVVCGSRAYGPLRRVLLGSTGFHVLHHARCSVVIVPRGDQPGAEAPIAEELAAITT